MACDMGISVWWWHQLWPVRLKNRNGLRLLLHVDIEINCGIFGSGEKGAKTRKDVVTVKYETFAIALSVCAMLSCVVGCGSKDDASSSTAEGLSEAPTPPAASEGSSSEGSSSEAPNTNASAEQPSPDTVIVTVDGKSLTTGMAMGMAQEMAARQGVPPQMMEQFMSQMGARLNEQIIDQFIGRTIVENEAARVMPAASDEEVDVVLARLTSTLPEGMTLEAALAAQNQTEADLRASIGSSEQVRKLYEEKTASLASSTDEAVNEFYTNNVERFTTEESITASHILISCEASADEAAHATAKAEAEAVLVELGEGGDFAELAKTRSSCPSKDRDGVLGTFARGKMVPEFEAAAFSQELGKVGEVVKTQFGYHIILATEKVDAGLQPLDAVSDDIRTQLDGQAKDKLFTSFVDSLRGKATIAYAEGAPAAAGAPAAPTAPTAAPTAPTAAPTAPTAAPTAPAAAPTAPAAPAAPTAP
jgi:peptidyl-prolyl cis-trans isomerase C